MKIASTSIPRATVNLPLSHQTIIAQVNHINQHRPVKSLRLTVESRHHCDESRPECFRVSQWSFPTCLCRKYKTVPAFQQTNPNEKISTTLLTRVSITALYSKLMRISNKTTATTNKSSLRVVCPIQVLKTAKVVIRF